MSKHQGLVSTAQASHLPLHADTTQKVGFPCPSPPLSVPSLQTRQCHAVVMCLTRGSDGACVVTVCQCCVGTSFVYGASTYADLLCSCWLCIHRQITSNKHTHTKAKSVQLSLSSSKYVCFVQLHANRHSGIHSYASIHTYIRIKMSGEHCMPLSQWQYS